MIDYTPCDAATAKSFLSTIKTGKSFIAFNPSKNTEVKIKRFNNLNFINGNYIQRAAHLIPELVGKCLYSKYIPVEPKIKKTVLRKPQRVHLDGVEYKSINALAKYLSSNLSKSTVAYTTMISRMTQKGKTNFTFSEFKDKETVVIRYKHVGSDTIIINGVPYKTLKQAAMDIYELEDTHENKNKIAHRAQQISAKIRNNEQGYAINKEDSHIVAWIEGMI